MKKFYIILITLLALNGVRAQSCLPEGITFSTQAQINNFQTNYPNCSQIEGDVTISGADITNLNGLSVLTNIGGHINIGNNYALTSLTGLNNVTHFGGNLEIGGNALTSLAPLENLTSIGGYLLIWNNNELTSLTGLDNIDHGSITDIYIYYNNSLSTCEVQCICDYLASPNGTIEISNNASGCNNQQEVETACGVGLNESKTSENQFNIYPNPTSTQITIETPTTIQKNTNLTIYTINNQQLITHQITESKTVIDIGDLASGVYFVRLTNDRTVKVGKFVKQ